MRERWTEIRRTIGSRKRRSQGRARAIFSFCASFGAPPWERSRIEI